MDVGSWPRRVRNLVVGSGYGSGGASVDKDGHAGFDGDVLVGGALTPLGLDRGWHTFLKPDGIDLYPRSDSSPCGDPTKIIFATTRYYAWTMSFVHTASKTCTGRVLLPPGYAGESLYYRVHWTSQAATTGNCQWVVGHKCRNDGDDLTDSSATAVATFTPDPFQGANLLHITDVKTGIPTNASLGGRELHLQLFTYLTGGQHTLDGAALLLGLEVGFR